MLTLNDGRKELYQWDTGRTATVDIECDVVHFSNLKYGESLAVEVKAGVVSIPNKLLMIGEPIYCWAFVADENGNYTKQEKTLNVNKRAKPSDYVYTETETLTWKSLDERITELEKGGTTSTMTGATADTDGAAGLVPAPKAGQNEKFLRGDGTWADVPQGGGGGTGNGDMQKTVYDPTGKATDVFAYAENAAESAVSAHNTRSDTHSDIRELITGLTNRLNALADSDDTTLDQLSEIVAYIKSNKSLIDAITTEKVSVSDIIDNLTTNSSNKPLSAAQGVALKALIDGITIPEKLPNPNALMFSGAVTGRYDGSSPVTVNIPSGGCGPTGGTGKAKSQILINQDISELTASLSVTLEHDFHNLTAIINCGSDGAALTAGSDGTAIVSKIGLMIDTTSFSYNSRKVSYIDTTTGTWKTMMFGAEWSDDLSVFKRCFATEIYTGASNKYYVSPFGGTAAMYGTLGTDDNAPRTGKTANIVVNGAYLNVGTKVVLWGEYYE